MKISLAKIPHYAKLSPANSITRPLPRLINFKFACSLTTNITSHSMKNSALHSLLGSDKRWLYYKFSPPRIFLFKRFGECTFWSERVKTWAALTLHFHSSAWGSVALSVHCFAGVSSFIADCYHRNNQRGIIVIELGSGWQFRIVLCPRNSGDWIGAHIAVQFETFTIEYSDTLEWWNRRQSWN